MINSQNIIDKVCAKIACGGMTELETCQTTGALNFLANPIVSVATFSALPSATLHQGRMVYVNDENRYYHAVDGFWLSKFDTTIFNYASLIFTWGNNDVGQLGTGNTTNRSSPVSVVGGFTDWCQVSVGFDNLLAIRTNGSLWAWGNNYGGRLGDNTTVAKCSPVSVIGGFTDWCQVSTSGAHTLAIRTNGTLWAWGFNLNGQLGTGNTTNRSSPVSVIGGFTDWRQASNATSHSLGVRQNGTLWAWGYQACGRLGNGNLTIGNVVSPVSVVGGFTDWCQASAGHQHSLGVRTDGSAWAWGRGYRGQLGNNTTCTLDSPVSVVGGFTDWCQVSAGYCHSLGLRTNGSLWAWGAGGFGQLGDATQCNRSSPVSVVGGFTDWCQVSAGNRHTVAVRQNGTAWAWGGNNSCGELGDGTTVIRTAPVLVSGGFTDWYQVSAGACIGAGVRQLQKGF